MAISIDAVKLGEVIWRISDKFNNADKEQYDLHSEFTLFVAIYDQLQRRTEQFILYPEQMKQWESALHNCNNTLEQVEKQFANSSFSGLKQKVGFVVKGRSRLVDALSRHIRLLQELDELIQRDATPRNSLEALRCDDAVIRQPMGATNYLMAVQNSNCHKKGQEVAAEVYELSADIRQNE